ncbi:hypothetical protein Cst_c05860 [Thermoclostridium stercorarium subsp. stercorarium DSM 8532]|uniref:ABC3 transporter permease C-terminal domain-containing protein n=2 Tax=Thermoclostridium stercorarium TaxID=1510 RepID=L7VPV3_THES1|nr:FtsX-like permease family protein [Thermoclostridium stercorarium]AGC67608.1 hypothetical protein Cst_c05860 [Thermoclostridium stercorarium subsp. stercorarium DSM 8532]
MKKLFYVFFTVQLTVFLIIAELLSFYIYVSVPSFNNIKDFSNHNIYRLTDNFLGEKENELFENKIGFQLLSEFNKEISNSPCFEYYEIDTTNIYIPKFEGDEIFVSGYEHGRPQPSAKISADGNSLELSCIKALHLSENVFSDFNIRLESGRMLNSEDFLYEKDSVLPVLLGSSYKGIFKIGDLIDTYNVYGNIRCEVVGFLQKGSSIAISQGRIFYLDRYIILPSFRINRPPQTESEKRAFIYKYLMKNGGIIKSEYDLKTVSEEIARIEKKVGLKNNSYVLIGQKFADSIFNMTVREIIVLLLCFTAVTALLLVISLYALVKVFIEKNINFLAVHLLCGAEKKDLYLIILREFLIPSGCSLILSLLLLEILFGIFDPFIFLTAACISLILVSVTAACSFGKHATIDKLLRREG